MLGLRDTGEERRHDERRAVPRDARDRRRSERRRARLRGLVFTGMALALPHQLKQPMLMPSMHQPGPVYRQQSPAWKPSRRAKRTTASSTKRLSGIRSTPR